MFKAKLVFKTSQTGMYLSSKEVIYSFQEYDGDDFISSRLESWIKTKAFCKKKKSG